jgi:hypothetical protein
MYMNYKTSDGMFHGTDISLMFMNHFSAEIPGTEFKASC